MSLLELASDTIYFSKDLEHDALEKVESLRVDWSVYLDIAMTQFDSLESVLLLLKKRAYKDCFTILRSVLEGTFFLRLMLYGKRFRETRLFKVSPKNGSDPKTLRDNILERWRKEKKAQNPNFNKVMSGSINPQGDDLISITIEDEGLYPNPNPKEQERITNYYFAFDDFDPETCFVAPLPTLSKVDPYNEQTQMKMKEQKILYHQYFYIDNIVRNLKLNNLLSDEQADRFRVHYNFLSTFVHTTKPGNFRRYQKQFPGSLTPEEVERAYVELIPSYVIKLEAILLETVANYFSNVNPQAKAKLIKYLDRVQRLNSCLDDFWFIYDNPTDFDQAASDGLKKELQRNGCPDIPEGIIYYRNPLTRLVCLRRQTKTPYKT